MTDEFTITLGMSLEELAQSPSLSWLGRRPTLELIHDRFYLDFPRAGVSFVASMDGRVSSVHFHVAGDEGYAQFDGDMSEGLRFEWSRKRVRAHLGAPHRTGGGVRVPVLGVVPQWDLFDRGRYSLHVQYAPDERSIDLVTLMRPDAVPE